MASIFKHEVGNLKEVLAGCSPAQILYVPIDVAKTNHSAMIVNFTGEVITPKFDFPYNTHGIQFLHHKIIQARKQTQAQKLFLGLEATCLRADTHRQAGHYHENLTGSLQAMGYDIQVIRPFDVSRERDNVHAKTDAIDLAAIARVLISQKGKRSYVPDDVYYNLLRASRTHLPGGRQVANSPDRKPAPKISSRPCSTKPSPAFGKTASKRNRFSLTHGAKLPCCSSSTIPRPRKSSNSELKD